MGDRKDTSGARHTERLYLYGQYEVLFPEEIDRMRRNITAIEINREQRTITADRSVGVTANNNYVIGDDIQLVPEGE